MQDIAQRVPLSPATAASDLIPRARFWDSIALFADVLLPTIAKGVIIRRPTMLRVAGALDLDRRAVRRMQRLRDRYGAGPLRGGDSTRKRSKRITRCTAWPRPSWKWSARRPGAFGAASSHGIAFRTPGSAWCGASSSETRPLRIMNSRRRWRSSAPPRIGHF